MCPENGDVEGASKAGRLPAGWSAPGPSRPAPHLTHRRLHDLCRVLSRGAGGAGQGQTPISCASWGLSQEHWRREGTLNAETDPWEEVCYCCPSICSSLLPADCLEYKDIFLTARNSHLTSGQWDICGIFQEVCLKIVSTHLSPLLIHPFFSADEMRIRWLELQQLS